METYIISIGVVIIILLIVILVSLVKLGGRIDFIENYLDYTSDEIKYIKNSMRASGSIPYDENSPLKKHLDFRPKKEEK